MKTKFLTLAMLITSLSICSAQEITPVRMGIKAGVNFSSLNTSSDGNSKMFTGFNVGVFSKIPLTSMVAIQPEFYLTTKGAAVSYNNLVANGTANIHLNYLELPILAVITLTENFNLHIGPYASYLLSANATNSSDVQLFDFEKNLKVRDFNWFDMGLAAGLGVDMGAVSLGARYNLGLIKVGRERSILGTTYTIPNATNSVINLYATLSLN